MKKKRKWGYHELFSITCKRLLIMKFFLFFMALGVLQSTASVYSQSKRISLNEQNIPIKEALELIENQSNFRFFYEEDNLRLGEKVTINISESPIHKVLDQLFEKQSVEYKVLDNNFIVLKSKEESAFLNPPQQKKTITGKVIDQSGIALPGVTILIEGTTNGTTTDLDGKYTLSNVPPNVNLVFTFIGMKPQTIAVAGQTTIDVAMEEENIGLGEVVVTALGIEKESKSLSYNVQQINGQEVNRVSDANFVNNLAGKVAGVTINSSSSGVGGSSRVVMRGVKSISGNNNALYVVDGVPMPYLSSNQPSDLFSGAGQTGDGASNINPDDIESISVLSGPSAAALYGSSAANGVILITTKKGKEGAISVNYTNSTLFSTPLVLPEFQNTYGQTETDSYESWGEKLSTPSNYDPADFFQTGVNISNSVSFSTGSERNQTYVSLGAVNAEGIIHSNDYDRYNLSVRNSSNFLDDKMTLDLSFMLSEVTEENMISQGLYSNPLVPVYLFPAGDDFSKVEIFERYNPSRNFKTQFWPYNDGGLAMQNPYWITERNKFINNKDRYMASASLKYNLTDWVNVSARAKMDRASSRYEKKFNASTNTLFASENGYYSLNQTENRQVYGELLVNINKYFNDDMFGLTANIGGSFNDVQYDQNMYGGNLAGVANLFTYSNVYSLTSESSQSGYHTRKNSLFASAQLGYKSMAYLDVTARNDWPSTLAKADNSSFFYPSVGLSGIITEIFDWKPALMPYMKVRVSYSEVGNEPDPYLTIPTRQLVSGYPVTGKRMQNTDLAPERTKAWEAGVNIYFLQNKLKLDATVYKSRTYNQFFQPQLSSTSGFTSVVVNAGQVDNKGIEATLRFNDKFGEFEWDSYVTYSLNRNKIVELLKSWKNPETGDIVSLTEIDMGGTGSYKMRLEEGGSMGAIYVNTLRTDEHGAIYVHPSDQIVVPESNNFVYAGNSSPKYNMGWGNNFRWKGLSLSMLLSARVGGIVVSNTQAIMDAFGVSKASADARDNGGALVNGKRIPANEYYHTIGGGASAGIGSMYCYSATNVRLSELTLGYDIPVSKWVNWIKGANISLTGRNLFFLYRAAPFDPETTANTGTYYQGIDYFMTPSTRNIGFSVKLHF